MVESEKLDAVENNRDNCLPKRSDYWRCAIDEGEVGRRPSMLLRRNAESDECDVVRVNSTQ